MVFSSRDSVVSNGETVYNAPTRQRQSRRKVAEAPSVVSSLGTSIPSIGSELSDIARSKRLTNVSSRLQRGPQTFGLPPKPNGKRTYRTGQPPPPTIYERATSNCSNSSSASSKNLVGKYPARKTPNKQHNMIPQSPPPPATAATGKAVRAVPSEGKYPHSILRSPSPNLRPPSPNVTPLSPSMHANAPSNTSNRQSVGRDGALSKKVQRKTFHVRVSLGYLTGLKMSQIKKKKWGSHAPNNGLVVGYASIAKSQKQMAFSQPLVPTFGERSSRAKHQKLIWASTRNGQQIQVSGSKTKRRLHFSVQMEPELEPVIVDDDESDTSGCNFFPEVVKLLIGLKCGEETLPLGIVNLVIHGKEREGQKIDLALRPLSEAPDIEIPNSGKPSRLGIFGSKRGRRSKNAFSSGDHAYSLASCATLRVRVDIKAGYQGQTKEEVWGQKYGDDESLLTNTSFDESLKAKKSFTSSDALQSFPFFHSTGGNHTARHDNSIIESTQDGRDQESGPTRSTARASQQLEVESLDKSLLSEWVEVMPNEVQGTKIVPSPKHKLPKREKQKYVLAAVKTSAAETFAKRRPVRQVFVRKVPDGTSLVSGLTHPTHSIQPLAFLRSCLPDAICGAFEVDETESALEERFSFGRENNYYATTTRAHASSWEDDDDSDCTSASEDVTEVVEEAYGNSYDEDVPKPGTAAFPLDAVQSKNNPDEDKEKRGNPNYNGSLSQNSKASRTSVNSGKSKESKVSKKSEESENSKTSKMSTVSNRSEQSKDSKTSETSRTSKALIESKASNTSKKSKESQSSKVSKESKDSQRHQEHKAMKQSESLDERVQPAESTKEVEKANGKNNPDLTLDTFTDLKEAQQTILRYANKLGIKMEDLLETKDEIKASSLSHSSSVGSVNLSI